MLRSLFLGLRFLFLHIYIDTRSGVGGMKSQSFLKTSTSGSASVVLSDYGNSPLTCRFSPAAVLPSSAPVTQVTAPEYSASCPQSPGPVVEYSLFAASPTVAEIEALNPPGAALYPRGVLPPPIPKVLRRVLLTESEWAMESGH